MRVVTYSFSSNHEIGHIFVWSQKDLIILLPSEAERSCDSSYFSARLWPSRVTETPSCCIRRFAIDSIAFSIAHSFPLLTPVSFILPFPSESVCCVQLLQTCLLQEFLQSPWGLRSPLAVDTCKKPLAYALVCNPCD